MPLPALLALLVAFWLPQELGRTPLPWTEPSARLGIVAGGLVLMAAVSWATGRRMMARFARPAPARPGRWWQPRASTVLDVLALLLYAVMIAVAGWPQLVEDDLGLRGSLLLDEILTYLPFPLLQVIGWWFLQPAERARRVWRGGGLGLPSRRRSLFLRVRQVYGLLVPVAGLLAMAQDVTYRLDPIGRYSPWPQLVGYLGTTVLIVLISPGLIRLSWPTKSLPAGPLRARLERLSQRLEFKYTDILLWDTGGAAVNAGVTGATPWFRYVLLTDGLVDCLEERQVEAVFGHEVGHVAHRHLNYFALFLLGSIGVMALLVMGVERYVVWGPSWGWSADDGQAQSLAQAAVAVGALGGYFFFVFGYLSRRFERQADLYGCLAVSCGREGCPPHADVNAPEAPLVACRSLCPVGVRLFIDALANVALLNGLEPSRRSWRHGSIASRIEFLEKVEYIPETEQRFQRRLRGLRAGLLLFLGTAMAAAYWSGALAAV